MTNESANSPFVGESKTVEPSTSIDDPANLNFLEPGEANEEEEEDQGSTVETDETSEDGQEADDSADQGDELAESDEDDAANEAQDTIVTLKGGEKVPLEELKLGYLRERDYRHKTQEVANKGRTLEAMTTRVANTANAIAEFLIQQLPAEPSYSLAIQNPGEYTRQKAVYDAALARVHQVIEMGTEPKAVAGDLTQSVNEETLAAENAKLLEAFPHLAKDDAREKFFADAFAVGQNLGFTPEEMQKFTDHRYFKVMHYAMLGLRAEQARAKAMKKVENAPPGAPKVKAKGPTSQKARQNQDAMKRLAKTGSIKDAMAIDFD